jgi:hypothetical protein
MIPNDGSQQHVFSESQILFLRLDADKILETGVSETVSELYKTYWF